MVSSGSGATTGSLKGNLRSWIKLIYFIILHRASPVVARNGNFTNTSLASFPNYPEGPLLCEPRGENKEDK